VETKVLDIQALIVSYGKVIHSKMISYHEPEGQIFALYEAAEDKDAFVCALIGQLIVYHGRLQRFL
jgi:hypothetical protein